MAAASLALQLERPQEAEELLLEQSQDDPAIRLLRGRIQTAKGDGAGAVALLEPLLAKHPQGMDLELRRALAEAYLAAQRPAEAAKMLAGKTGNHPALVLLLGRAEHRAGNAAAALATLKPFADKLPADRSAVGDPRRTFRRCLCPRQPQTSTSPPPPNSASSCGWTPSGRAPRPGQGIRPRACLPPT